MNKQFFSTKPIFELVLFLLVIIGTLVLVIGSVLAGSETNEYHTQSGKLDTDASSIIKLNSNTNLYQLTQSETSWQNGANLQTSQNVQRDSNSDLLNMQSARNNLQ